MNVIYDIKRGLLSQTGKLLSERLKSRRALLVCDDITASLYAGKVTESLKNAGFDVASFVFPHGEANKTWSTAGSILEAAAGAKLTRSDFFISLGGGVCGDITGFAAAVYLRGVKFVQIPTTLLAAVDASVGGKTGVDLGAGKNLAGAFHQPECVLFDPDVIGTLSKEQLDEGKAEIIKHAVLAGGRLYGVASCGAILDDIEKVVAMNVEIKRKYVEADPCDTGCRQLLNFGHTIGHAIEKLKNFELLHGQCVALGSVAAAYISWKRGTLSEEEFYEIRDMNVGFDLPISFDSLSCEDIVAATKHDKKMANGQIRYVLLRGIGNAYIDTTVTDEEMLAAVETMNADLWS